MILIIDDDNLEAQVLAIMLRQQYRVSGESLEYIVMTTGSDALEWLRGQLPQSVTAVILDRHLKHREDGLNLIVQLRGSDALTNNSAIIVRSIADDPDSIAAAYNAQADGFISKSRRVSTKKLLDLLDNLWQYPQRSSRPWIAITM